MKEEVTATCEFISSLLTENIDPNKLDNFRISLGRELVERYNNHWYKNIPSRGSGYRSILVDEYGVDKSITDAAKKSEINEGVIRSMPACVLYCNPGQVKAKVRFNDGRGKIFNLYQS